MSLRELAESDLGSILEDGTTGFGWPITLTDPAGKVGSFTGFSDDIAQIIDPDTGEAVSGRLASVVLRISSLYAEGFTLPRAIADSSGRPWIVEFNDIHGNPYKFKIAQSNPDRALGLLSCVLEFYK
jgi:hypothetical protein